MSEESRPYSQDPVTAKQETQERALDLLLKMEVIMSEKGGNVHILV